MADLIWMEHNETHGRAQLPDLTFWRERGWAPCDGPPPEPDLLHDPALPPPGEPVNLESQPADAPPATDLDQAPADELVDQPITDSFYTAEEH